MNVESLIQKEIRTTASDIFSLSLSVFSRLGGAGDVLLTLRNPGFDCDSTPECGCRTWVCLCTSTQTPACICLLGTHVNTMKRLLENKFVAVD